MARLNVPNYLSFKNCVIVVLLLFLCRRAAFQFCLSPPCKRCERCTEQVDQTRPDPYTRSFTTTGNLLHSIHKMEFEAAQWRTRFIINTHSVPFFCHLPFIVFLYLPRDGLPTHSLTRSLGCWVCHHMVDDGVVVGRQMQFKGSLYEVNNSKPRLLERQRAKRGGNQDKGRGRITAVYFTDSELRAQVGNGGGQRMRSERENGDKIRRFLPHLAHL